jgi:hypothetical protein
MLEGERTAICSCPYQYHSERKAETRVSRGEMFRLWCVGPPGSQPTSGNWCRRSRPSKVASVPSLDASTKLLAPAIVNGHFGHRDHRFRASLIEVNYFYRSGGRNNRR